MPSVLKEGEKAPDFALETAAGEIRLRDYKGRHLVLYFYPKDDTPGCTTEALAFSALAADIAEAGADIVGVSRDTVASHEKFSKKHGIGIVLASDIDGTACAAYGVWGEKSMYGKKFMGITRATFLIDPKGKLAKTWPKVNVKGHAEAVLAALKA
jgi:thioredoxin-dependent peroxiredoxin